MTGEPSTSSPSFTSPPSCSGCAECGFVLVHVLRRLSGRRSFFSPVGIAFGAPGATPLPFPAGRRIPGRPGVQLMSQGQEPRGRRPSFDIVSPAPWAGRPRSRSRTWSGPGPVKGDLAGEAPPEEPPAFLRLASCRPASFRRRPLAGPCWPAPNGREIAGTTRRSGSARDDNGEDGDGASGSESRPGLL